MQNHSLIRGDPVMNSPIKQSDELECTSCKEKLVGKKYLKCDNKAVCIACFEKHHAHRCLKCQMLIGPEQREANHKDGFWHDSCFTCSNCNVSLVEKEFAYKSKKLYCFRCYEKMPASKCCKCGYLFRDGQVTYEFDDKYLHEDCFKCQHCSQLIRSSLFIIHNEKPLCVSCYENNYASKCETCDKVISNGGVKVGEYNWHDSCFTCDSCNKNLMECEFTMSGRKLFCFPCFKQKKDKKCHQCSGVITDDDSSSFVSFNSQNWHCGCFNCSECGSNLVDKGFMMSENDLKCPYCARGSFKNGDGDGSEVHAQGR